MEAAEVAVVGVISLPVLRDFLWWGRLRLSLNPPNPVLARTKARRQKDLNSLNIIRTRSCICLRLCLAL